MRSIALFALMLCACVPLTNAAAPAAAENGVLTLQQKFMRRQPALVLYNRYAYIIRIQGAQELKSLTTPDFTLQGTAEKFKGAAAIAELDKYLSVLDKNSQIKIRLRRIEMTENTLVAYTEETMFVDKRQDTFSFDWDWKQTWHKTAQGWKLALDEHVSPSDARKIKEDNPVCIITSSPDDAHSTATK